VVVCLKVFVRPLLKTSASTNAFEETIFGVRNEERSFNNEYSNVEVNVTSKIVKAEIAKAVQKAVSAAASAAKTSEKAAVAKAVKEAVTSAAVIAKKAEEAAVLHAVKKAVAQATAAAKKAETAAVAKALYSAAAASAAATPKDTKAPKETTTPERTLTSNSMLQPNVRNNSKHHPVCSWQADPAPFLWETTATERKVHRHVSALSFLTNVWGLTFTLDEGSLVGAFRQRGPCDCDIDLDVALPIWLNTRMIATCLKQPSLHCADADERPLPRRTCQNCGAGKKLLCGLSRSLWMSKWQQCFTRLISTHSKRKDGPGRFTTSVNGMFIYFGSLKIDMTISQIDARYGPGIDVDFDRKVAKFGVPQDGVPCLCKYGTFDALCFETESTYASLAEKYGAEFMWTVFCGPHKVNSAIFKGAQNLTRYQRLVAPVRQGKSIWLNKSSADGVAAFSIISKKRY